MNRIKPYVLPVAIVAGLLLHSQAMLIAWLVPYLIFAVLLINFTAVDLKHLGFCRLDLRIMVFQAVVSAAAYAVVSAVTPDRVLAQGAMMAVLCPVASSVVVVASALGADRRITTGYTIYGNMLVAVLAPVYFTVTGRPDVSFVDSVCGIFAKIFMAIALPYFIGMALQLFLPKVSRVMSRAKEWTLILWAISLMLVLGQTIGYVIRDHAGHETTIVWLGVISLVACVVQFGVGRIFGIRAGHPVAGTQLLGQKNTAIGIWMAVQFLSPLSSVTLAFYAVFQNIFNSWQLWRNSRR